MLDKIDYWFLNTNNGSICMLLCYTLQVPGEACNSTATYILSLACLLKLGLYDVLDYVDWF